MLRVALKVSCIATQFIILCGAVFFIFSVTCGDTMGVTIGPTMGFAMDAVIGATMGVDMVDAMGDATEIEMGIVADAVTSNEISLPFEIGGEIMSS